MYFFPVSFSQGILTFDGKKTPNASELPNQQKGAPQPHSFLPTRQPLYIPTSCGHLLMQGESVLNVGDVV